MGGQEKTRKDKKGRYHTRSLNKACYDATAVRNVFLPMFLANVLSLVAQNAESVPCIEGPVRAVRVALDRYNTGPVYS